jgi:hypothetical protein
MAAGDRRLVTAAATSSAHPRRQARLAQTALESYGLLWLGTLLVAIVAIPIAGEVRSFMGLRLTTAPSGSAGMASFLAANNLRVAAVPLLLAALSSGRRRWLPIVGDLVVSASLVVNVALGGLALGAYGPRLVPYLPQWPLEWGALALALTGWRRARHWRRDACELLLLATSAALLICLAALLETYAVPQA